MSRNEDNNQSVAIDEIVELLSQLRSGKTTVQLTNDGDNKKLKRIVDEVNALALALQEQAQAQAQAELQSLLDASPSTIFIKDQNGKYLLCNDTYAKKIQRQRGDIIGKTVFDIFPAAVAEKMNANDRSVFDSGKSRLFEIKIPSADGERWSLVSLFPLTTPSGDISGVGGIITDVHDQVMMKEQLTAANTQLDDYFSASLDLICVANTDGFFKRVNPSFSRILGYSEQELVSQGFLNFIHRDDVSATTKIVESLAEGKLLLHFENRYRCKSGEYRIISWHCQPNTKTGDLYATGRDVTEQRMAEASLKNLMIALNQSAIVSFTDEKGCITEVNENFCKISGYSRSELMGKTHQIINSGEHDRAFFADVWKTISQGSIWTGDIKNRKKDGSYYWVRTVISPVQDLESSASRYVAIRFDITDQKNMEHLNRKIGDDLKEAQSIAKIGSWSFDLLTQNLTWSSEHYKIFDITEPQSQEDLYRLYRRRIHKDDLAKLDLLVERAANWGEGFVYDHRLVKDDGTIKYVQGIGTVTKNADGAPVRISGTCQDMSERVESEKESRFILDGLGVGVWKWDLITNELEWDDNMYRLYGAERKDFNGAYDAWENSLSPETKAKAIEEINAAATGEKDFDTTFQVVHKSEKIQEIRTRAFVIRDGNGKPLKMHGINVDRTHEAELEKSVDRERAKAVQNAKLASLGEMSAGIAHEINNPLAIIYGAVRALPKFVNNPELLASKIQTINTATERIAKIVRSLKKFSRTSDKSEYKIHSLCDIIKEAVVLTAAKAQRHTTKVDVDCKSECYVLCDEIEIEQIFVNMINNAIDAVKGLSEKWVTLELRESDGRVLSRIKDSGPRISSDIEKKMFQPFFTTKPVGKGTGLGLSITKGILDEHHATIELVADDPHTCFEIRFLKADPPYDHLSGK